MGDKANTGQSLDDCTDFTCIAVGGCPSITGHRRIEDAHLLLHKCFDSYLDPAAFRTYLNALIQALRNVTFAVQKDIAHVDGGAQWYEAWQSLMRADDYMKWLVAARNRVVKEGDLNQQSTAAVFLVENYFSAASLVQRSIAEQRLRADVEVKVTATAPLEEILDAAREAIQSQGSRSYATLFVERRWEVPELPGLEVLYVAGHALTVLAMLVADLDVQFSDARNQPALNPENLRDESKRERLLDVVRPPCMSGSHQARTQIFQIKEETGEIEELELALNFDTKKFPVDKEALDRAFIKYGSPVPIGRGRKSMEELADYCAENARGILATGEDHGWFAFFYRDGLQVHTELLVSFGNEDKWELAIRVARIADSNAANGIVMVSEVWIGARPAEGEPMVRASEQPDRREAVQVVAADAYGNRAMRLVPFRRSAFGTVDIGETVRDEGAENFFFEPLYTMWNEKYAYGDTR